MVSSMKLNYLFSTAPPILDAAQLLSRLMATLTFSWQRTSFSHWRFVDEHVENLHRCIWKRIRYFLLLLVSFPYIYKSNEKSSVSSFFPQSFPILSFIHSIYGKIMWPCKKAVLKFWWIYIFWAPKYKKKVFFIWMYTWMCVLLVPEELDGFSTLYSLFGVSLYLAKPSCSGSCSRFFILIPLPVSCCPFFLHGQNIVIVLFWLW